MGLEALCWLATVAYALHILEEFLLDWRGWVRQMSGVQVSLGFFWGMNGLAIALGAVCAEAAGRYPVIALAFPALMVINATVFHVGAVVWTRGGFSPGILTAVALFYPVGIWCFKSAYDAGVLTVATLVGSFGLGALLMATPFLLLRAGTMGGGPR